MHFEDEIYGKIEVNEPVLVEIINSYELQADGSLCRYSELDTDYGAKIANLPKFKQYSVRLRDELEKLAG